MIMMRWLIVLLILISSHSYGARITVHPSTGGIQSAVDAANEGDEIIVTPGIYYENILFSGKNLIVRSTDPTSPTVVATTIIDGNATATVVTFSGSEDASFIFEGFTIRNGYSENEGGGISGNLTSATIRNCVISKNRCLYNLEGGANGGGIAGCRGKISYCRISENRATFKGGGIYGCASVDHCEITSNTAQNSEGDGGGANNCDSITNSRITGNWAGWWGGGICYSNNIGNCLISGNISGGGGGGLSKCMGSISNCVISNNLNFGDQSEAGGGIYDSAADITNCTITGNLAQLGWGECDGHGGGLAGCSGKIRNCIIWGNKADAGDAQIHRSSVPAYSCIQQWAEGGNGNITRDPRMAQDGIHLKIDSPCIDTGSSGSLASDYDGDARPSDGDGKGKGNTGDGSDLDIGADERLLYLTIAASAGNGGKIIPSGDIPVAFGADQSFAVEARNGYEINKVMVDGLSVGKVSLYKFSGIAKNHAIEAKFRSITAADASWIDYQ